MKNLLLITSHILPSKDVGAIRPTKFARYLPQYGWQPLVLTPNRGQQKLKCEIDGPVFYARFPNLEGAFGLARRLLPRSINAPPTASTHSSVIKLAGRRQIFIDWLLIPDQGITWMPFAISKSLAIAKNYKIDAIMATAMDFSCLLVGAYLAHHLKCPWVADFRDPWLTNPFTCYPTLAHQRINALLERQVIKTAARVVTVSEPIQRDFILRYPDQPPQKFKIIYNGYDSADFANLKTERTCAGNFVHVVHSGSLYPGRKPVPFLQALKLLDQVILDKLKITFLGVNALELKGAVQQLGLEEVVTLKDYLPYRQSLQYLADADILLVIPGLGQGSLTTKLFEYLKLGKFILALTPASNTAMVEVLEKANVGLIVDSDASDEIAQGLTRLVEMITAGEPVTPNWPYIEQFDRKNLTKQLAQILNEVVS